MTLHPDQQASDDITLLVDGRFTMVVAPSPTVNEEYAPAFLVVRDSNGKDVCVGYCKLQFDGTWHTRLTVTYDESSQSDSMLIGDFDSRVDAVVQLWLVRHDFSYQMTE